MDTIIHPVPTGSSVSSVLATLNVVRDLLNANEDPAQENSLGSTHGDVQARFVAEPIRSISDGGAMENGGSPATLATRNSAYLTSSRPR